MTIEGSQAVLDGEFLRGVKWHRLSPPVLRWIRTRVELLINDPERLAALGTWDPNHPGKTKTLADVQGDPVASERCSECLHGYGYGKMLKTPQCPILRGHPICPEQANEGGTDGAET